MKVMLTQYPISLVRLVACAVVFFVCIRSVVGADSGRSHVPGNLVANGDFVSGITPWRIRFDEEAEARYSSNDEWVTVAEAEDGAVASLCFHLTKPVADAEGVKAVTPMMPVNPGVSYEFGCRIRSLGPSPKVMLEGYVEDSTRTSAGADQYPGFRRVYRAVIHPKDVGPSWTAHSRIVSPTARYQPTHVLIKLYAYLGSGDIFFTDVFLREVDE